MEPEPESEGAQNEKGQEGQEGHPRPPFLRPPPRGPPPPPPTSFHPSQPPFHPGKKMLPDPGNGFDKENHPDPAKTIGRYVPYS